MLVIINEATSSDRPRVNDMTPTASLPIGGPMLRASWFGMNVVVVVDRMTDVLSFHLS